MPEAEVSHAYRAPTELSPSLLGCIDLFGRHTIVQSGIAIVSQSALQPPSLSPSIDLLESTTSSFPSTSNKASAMSDTTPVYYTVAGIAASAKKGREPVAIKHKHAPPISVQKEQHEQHEKSAVMASGHRVFGKMYTYFKPRDTLRLDDDRDFKVEKGEEMRRKSLENASVKVRDFAYEAHSVKVAESCNCRHTNKQRQEWNQVLKHHNLNEIPIRIPQQVQPGNFHPSNATTRVPTEKNSPVATRPPSPVHHSPRAQLNAGDLVAALDVINLVQDTAVDDAVASEVDKSNPSALPGSLAVLVAKEEHITVDAGCANESSSPAAQSIPAAGPPHTPFHASTSALSLMVFGGGSPLTPLPLTPHISTLAITLKRKRSDASVGRAANNKDVLHRKVAMGTFDAARPKKKNRKVAETAGSTSKRKTAKASRASSRKQATSSTIVVPTTPAAAAAPRVRPTASVRRRRAGVEDIAGTPSEASKTSKKTAN